MIVNPLRIFASLFVIVVGVSAQTVDSCIQGCLTNSASAETCTDATNLTCICANTAFQAAVAACLTANCTSTDLTDAQALQQSQCSSLTSNSTTNATSSTSSTPKPSSTSSTSSATTPSSSSSTKSGAVHDQVPFLNAAFAIATVALGGAFLL